MEELKVLNEIMIQDTCAKKIHDEVLLKSQERLKSLRDKINDEFSMLHNTFTVMIERNKKKVDYTINFNKFHPDNIIENVTLRGVCKVYKDASNEEIKSEIFNKHNFKIEI